MKNKLITITLMIFLIAFVSATPLNELLDSINDIEIIITQDSSNMTYNFNTTGTSFDLIPTITYGDITLSNLYISSLLGGINAELRVIEGMNYGQFEWLNIILGSVTQALIDNGFGYLGINLSSEQINNNVTLMNDLLKNNPLNVSSPASINFTKQNIHYIITTNKGMGDIPQEIENKIRKIIEDNFYLLNLREGVDRLIPLTSYNLSILGNLDLDFDVGIVDLDNMLLRDGTYEVIVFVTRGNETLTKNILVKLKGIQSMEETIVNYTYIPSLPEISETIEKITGFENDTTITIYVFDEYEITDDNLLAFKFLNISVNKQTSAQITFKLEKDRVGNQNKVNLYIYENEWVKLDTDLINSSVYYIYRATIPHFSLFMIAEELEEEDESGSSGSSGGSSGSRTIEEDYTEYPLIEKPKPTTKELDPIITLNPPKSDEKNYKNVYLILMGIILLVIIVIIAIKYVLRKEKPNYNEHKKLEEQK